MMALAPGKVLFRMSASNPVSQMLQDQTFILLFTQLCRISAPKLIALPGTIFNLCTILVKNRRGVFRDIFVGVRCERKDHAGLPAPRRPHHHHLQLWIPLLHFDKKNSSLKTTVMSVSRLRLWVFPLQIAGVLSRNPSQLLRKLFLLS